MAGKTKEQIEQELAAVMLQSAQLDLDEKIESNRTRLAQKTQRERMMRERMTNLKIGRDSLRENAEKCEHLQGAPIASPLEGGDERQSMLVVTRMPDGWSRLIYCANCRGQWWTPHPRFMQEEPFKAGTKMPAGVILEVDETRAEAAARVRKFNADTEKFTELLKKAKKKLSDEAKQEGDSGTTHTNIMKRTGQQVFPWRACDQWPQVDLKAEREAQRQAA
jgi:hypothetical protein